MQTLRSAAALLGGATSADALVPLVRALGIEGTAVAVDGALAERLGLPPEIEEAHLVRGAGALRALIVEARGGPPLRDLVVRVASRLSARAPHLLWLLAAAERLGSGVALAAWTGERHPPTVAALVADRTRLVPSDAETVCALAAARGGLDVLVHARWREVLGREAVTRRFFRALERLVGELAAGAGRPDERREVALLYISRLLFLSFLEAKGWLDGDRGFLASRFERCAAEGGGFHRRVLLPLFFGTLNTPPAARAPRARALGAVPFLNGGLFARTAAERRLGTLHFDDGLLGRVFSELLSRYRFTAREDGGGWSEAAVDPEMLGRAFESLMASHDRRVTGSFYTPHRIVGEATRAALIDALAGDGLPGEAIAHVWEGGPLAPPEAAALAGRVRRLRVLDPACGSGAFLVHALERLSALAAAAGDARAPDVIRREVLTRSIFGVDLDPTAVWLCELRLWLSVVIEGEERDPLRVPPLPNLDHHVRVGDALSGPAFDATVVGSRAGARLTRLRARYARATGRRKLTLARALEREERARAAEDLARRASEVAARRADLLAAVRGRDLFGGRRAPAREERTQLDDLRARARALRDARRRLLSNGALPFSFPVHFADVGTAGGFDVVLGNPPWVRLHNIAPAARTTLRRDYVVYREAAWEAGAAGAEAGTGFASQVDLAALFTERAHSLLRPGGTLAFLLPAKLWRSLAGGGVRRLLAECGTLRTVDDWSESRAGFDAAVYPSLVVARRRAAPAPGDDGQTVTVVVRRRDDALRWTMPAAQLAFDGTPGSPWLLLPPEARLAFDAIVAAGAPLHSTPLGRPHLGVKCGRNEAFVVTAAPAEADAPLTPVRAAERQGCIERALLRPVLRGERLAPWRAAPSVEHIIWTHGAGGAPLEALPPNAARWLATWRRQLLARSDARSDARWWTLFRVEAGDASAARVVWGDVGRKPRASVLAPGDPAVPLNSCYVVRAPSEADAHALAALLNSAPCCAWLAALAEPARGGYRRYLGWTVALLPVPRDWRRARRILAPIGERAAAGGEVAEDRLTGAVLEAYGLAHERVAALMTWTSR